ncbi:relaxase/mobilization nuclease domain-containing protein [Gordonia tangerina]|uniref:Relaxase/mobilization nuclease domain-containing protein n=1 Tax=Gordonia tangerina TaxID=2911060 RepID=A0ABS9DNA4_9ACTN|nr:relaxase/mobilization nuclease domain-containing protein [Gordonia tangerina]MCF3940637.1 relaxase/mobilization nuclease domain-containing protein [Gordonia tangerina]
MPMMPAISSGARMNGLVMYLAGPGKANEHTNPHVVAASTREVFTAGGGGAAMTRESAMALGQSLDEARVVFGTEVTRRDTAALKAAQERGATGHAAIAEATRDENVWHCSLSLPPDSAALDEATWSAIAHDFMTGMGFDDPDAAAARWVAIHHGTTKNGGDHIHIAASRVRDDGTVVAKWRPHPTRGGNEGDYARAQRVARDLENTYGLEVLSSYTKNMAARGRAHAQDAATKPQRAPDGSVRDPRIAEAPSVTLARRVRAIAAAAESEAEFVRLARADGLVMRSARYDKADVEAVTGFSVGLPAAEYANQHGRPIMHGGKKLGEDLSLPRLRERWIDDDKARADARAAWDHVDVGSPFGGASRPAPTRPATAPGRDTSGPASDSTRDASASARSDHSSGTDMDAVQARLRSICAKLARASATEADYARALRDHPDILARPRFAKGSATDVVGYVVALHPTIAADNTGTPIWRNASYLGDGLALSELRARAGWPTDDNHRRLASAAWTRTRRDTGKHRTTGTDDPRVHTAHQHARRWERTVTSVTDTTSPGWHTAAGDTAAALSAASRGLNPRDAASVNQLADALSGVAGHRRPTQSAGTGSRTAAQRVAATMLAASRDDTTLLWLATMKQVLAASKAISAAMDAQGHHRQAEHIRGAINTTAHHFADHHYISAPPHSATVKQAQPAAQPATERTIGTADSYER